MWADTGTAWAIVSSVLSVVACMHAAQELCGILHPLHRMPLAKRGNEDIAFFGGYCAFVNFSRTCASLTTWENVGLRFELR